MLAFQTKWMLLSNLSTTNNPFADHLVSLSSLVGGQVIRARPEKKLQHRVVCELSDLRTFRSGLYKKIAEVYAAAYANRSYTHFRA